MEPKHLQAGRGWEWIKQGYALFMKAPLLWIVLLLICVIAAVALSSVPVVGEPLQVVARAVDNEAPFFVVTEARFDSIETVMQRLFEHALGANAEARINQKSAGDYCAVNEIVQTVADQVIDDEMRFSWALFIARAQAMMIMDGFFHQEKRDD